MSRDNDPLDNQDDDLFNDSAPSASTLLNKKDGESSTHDDDLDFDPLAQTGFDDEAHEDSPHHDTDDESHIVSEDDLDESDDDGEQDDDEDDDEDEQVAQDDQPGEKKKNKTLMYALAALGLATIGGGLFAANSFLNSRSAPAPRAQVETALPASEAPRIASAQQAPAQPAAPASPAPQANPTTHATAQSPSAPVPALRPAGAMATATTLAPEQTGQDLPLAYHPSEPRVGESELTQRVQQVKKELEQKIEDTVAQFKSELSDVQSKLDIVGKSQLAMKTQLDDHEQRIMALETKVDDQAQAISPLIERHKLLIEAEEKKKQAQEKRASSRSNSRNPSAASSTSSTNRHTPAVEPKPSISVTETKIPARPRAAQPTQPPRAQATSAPAPAKPPSPIEGFVVVATYPSNPQPGMPTEKAWVTNGSQLLEIKVGSKIGDATVRGISGATVSTSAGTIRAVK